MELVRSAEILLVGRLLHDMCGRKMFQVQREVNGVPTAKIYSLKQILLVDEEQAALVLGEVQTVLGLHHASVLRCYSSWIGGDVEEGGITELPLAAIPGRQIPPRAPPMPASLSAANPQAAPLFAYMLMDSVDMDLRTMLMMTANNPRYSSDSQRWKWTRQIAEGLVYLHSHHHLVHRDVTPWKLFLSRSGGVQFGDFQHAVRIQPGQRAYGVKHVEGTDLTDVCLESIYSSPELGTTDIGYDAQADIFSWALVVVLLWLGSDAGDGALVDLNDIEGVSDVLEEVRTTCRAPQGWARRHFRLNSLVNRALQLSAELRPSAREIVASLKLGEALFADVRYINVRYGGTLQPTRGFGPVSSRPGTRDTRHRKNIFRSSDSLAGVRDTTESDVRLAHFSRYHIDLHGAPSRRVEMELRKSTVNLQTIMLTSSRHSTPSTGLDAMTAPLPRVLTANSGGTGWSRPVSVDHHTGILRLAPTLPVIRSESR
eukprot:CAMPEP_0114319304 /NCGR_PEP_ID=MMETSP0059-20121206/25165_1 /TAXON_ID=36894 /ORGANISM="Pyramimonas parkeae, Strain CCMP726" /LENGTH=484 /DNA_ID=CAMNT_0001446293 /DNA_START=166 /DNA_END=1620 /DNA_ORIENTATION=+